MELTAYSDESAFDILSSEWNALLKRAPMDRIFYTREWHKTWWQAYRPGEPLILAAREGEVLAGIAPLFLTETDRGRSAQIIGCVDVTDYLDFIVDEAHQTAVYSAFADYLASRRDQFDVLDFCNIPYDSASRAILPDLLAERGFDVTVEQQEVCPVIKLPNNWAGYLSSLDKKQRHEVRRKMRRAQGSDRAIDWYIVNGQQILEEEVSHFVRLMAASDPEKERFPQRRKQHALFPHDCAAIAGAGLVADELSDRR